MTTNVKIYRSTDPGAAAITLYGNVPGSTGGDGGWIGVLRACLINGYGSKDASSVTVSSGVATFNCVAHGFIVGQCLLLAGATSPSTVVNGERYVTATTANTFTFATAHGNGAVTTTGTITAKVAPAGWTEPYSPTTTNITCFKQGGGNGFYFNINETAVQTSVVHGFESMTACNIANGTGAFPTTAQLATGVYWQRSDATNTVTRQWIILATDRHLYLHVEQALGNFTGSANFNAFADLKSYRPGDAYATLLIGNNSAGASGSLGYAAAIGTTGVPGHFLARSYLQIGGSVAAGKTVVDSGGVTLPTTVGSSSAIPFPHPVNQSMWTTQIRVFDTGYSSSLIPRGILPGIIAPMHNIPLTHRDTFTGSGDLAGKTFMAVSFYQTSQVFFETSNTWDI